MEIMHHDVRIYQELLVYFLLDLFILYIIFNWFNAWSFSSPMFFQSLFIFIYLLVLLNNIILSYLYLLFYIYLNNIIIIKCRFLGHHHIVFIIFNFGFINALFSLISGLGKSGIITLSLCIYWLVLFSISYSFNN